MNRKIKILIALVIFSGAIFFSCEEEDIDPMTLNTGTFSASVSNTDFIINDIVATVFATETDSTLEIVATDNDGSIITLQVGSLQLGSYDVSNTNANAEFRNNVENGVSVSENTLNGNINLSSINQENNIVSGSFSFTTDNSIISNGEFTNLIYTLE